MTSSEYSEYAQRLKRVSTRLLLSKAEDCFYNSPLCELRAFVGELVTRLNMSAKV